MKETLQTFLISVLIVLGSLFLISLLLQNLYSAIRLYQTGEVQLMEVTEKKPVIHHGKNGPTVTGHVVLVKETSSELYVVSDLHYFKINFGDKVKVLFSEQINKGIVFNKSIPGFFTIVFTLEGYGTIFLVLAGIFLLIVLLKHAIKANYKIISDRFIKAIDIANDDDSMNQSYFSFWLVVIKKIVPDLVVISFMYLVAILSIRSLLIIESYSKFGLGLVIFVSTLTFLFFPWLTFTLKQTFSQKVIVKNSISLVKIALGLYGIVKTINFINNSTNNESDLQGLILDYLKYLINF
ncbi:hypothetical protein [Aquimarina rubra]|uniref:Uncharacterized protein n=1 Tax=Aquimarina rubra TaxID=1920033 RepID=A0ABW5LL62_9FLAO